jgi:hypothetical protein
MTGAKLAVARDSSGSGIFITSRYGCGEAEPLWSCVISPGSKRLKNSTVPRLGTFLSQVGEQLPE